MTGAGLWKQEPHRAGKADREEKWFKCLMKENAAVHHCVHRCVQSEQLLLGTAGEEQFCSSPCKRGWGQVPFSCPVLLPFVSAVLLRLQIEKQTRQHYLFLLLPKGGGGKSQGKQWDVCNLLTLGRLNKLPCS